MVKKIITAKHRGFCAGVERAVEMVEKSLLKYGAPVYVRHEIVHNKFVVNNLREKGVVFVDSLEEIPKNTKQPVIFSAHGVAQRVINKAKDYNLLFYDAICPLVSKIHKEIIQLEKNIQKWINVKVNKMFLSMIKFNSAQVVKLVDTRDLKSLGDNTPCRFESGPGHKSYESFYFFSWSRHSLSFLGYNSTKA